MRRISLCVLLLLSTYHGVLLAETSKALSPIEQAMSERVQVYVEDAFLRHVREKTGRKLRDFRYVTTPENTAQPQRHSKLIKIGYGVTEGKLGGVTVTVHNRRTGAPLYSCVTPCELKVRKPRKHFLIYYKAGYHPKLVDLGGRYGQKSFSDQLWDRSSYYHRDKLLAERCRVKTSSRSIGKICKNRVWSRSNSWSNTDNGFGQCDLSYEVDEDGFVRNVQNVRCDNTKICLEAYRFANKLVYHSDGAALTKTQWSIGYAASDIEHDDDNVSAAASEKFECFPAPLSAQPSSRTK